MVFLKIIPSTKRMPQKDGRRLFLHWIDEIHVAGILIDILVEVGNNLTAVVPQKHGHHEIGRAHV